MRDTAPNLIHSSADLLAAAVGFADAARAPGRATRLDAALPRVAEALVMVSAGLHELADAQPEDAEEREELARVAVALTESANELREVTRPRALLPSRS